ncbi:MAG: hypothetical protein NTY96_09395 [Bacteroidetes bacterium]|nr:hypothetical protein [Bacteroidota bacterium]
MKKLIIVILLAGCLISPALAQQNPSPRFHEFGIIFSDLNNFGLRYKYGGDKSRFRFSLLTMNLLSSNLSSDQSSSGTIKQTGYGAGFRIGFDNKVPLFGSFSLLLGAEAGLNYNYSHLIQTDPSGTTNLDQTETSLAPGLSFIFGVNYVVKDHLVLGAEINPTVSYVNDVTKHKQTQEFELKTKSIAFSLATAGAGLYIAYRFGK